MAIQAKVSFLHLLVAILLLCEVLAQRSTGRNSRRPVTRNRLRSGEECKDEEGSHEICVKVVKELGFGVCHTEIDQLKAKLERSCAQTCHYCGKPQQGCRTSQYGCCWDVYTPRGDIYGKTGCPECKDHLNLCKRFQKFCKSKKEENKATGTDFELNKHY
ncbi:hypothetical protein ACROYT_G008703 [Oculina patagonica]